ncbi:sensor histidine kinase [Thermophagus sp. OGC60D27]|uniref:sensor histidine kinase n=1 Tax=Thermophagus sp. OGC60D27 TaxID=3458415 RepID=UPI004037F2B8
MTKKKYPVLVFLSYGLVSMLIGFVFQWIMCPQCLRHPMAVIQNLGYSIMLGYGLFFNGYLYNIGISRFVSWQTRPVKSVLIAFFITTIYSGMVIFFTNWFWFSLIQGMPFGLFLKTYPVIWVTEFVILYIITLWFYARSFFMDWLAEVQKREALKREALTAKYEVLKSQVNPHFLFNSLNVAASLIDQNSETSKQFLYNLAGMYRSILEMQDSDLVTVEAELQLTARYLWLQEMRFGNAFHYSLPEEDLANYSVVPLSIQMLMENAFKHNIFSLEKPMHISVSKQAETLVVKNTRYASNNGVESLNIGLENVRGRYRFLTGKEIDIIHEDGIFEVRIPLIKNFEGP